MAFLKGNIREIEGKPVKEASIYVFGEGPRPVIAHTDENGRFALDSLKPGPHFLRISATGFMTLNEHVVVPSTPEAQNMSLDFILHKGAVRSLDG